MDSPTRLPPLPYQTVYEVAEADEQETVAALLENLHKISDITFKDSGHALRSVHAKSHGLLTGHLRVLDDLPPELAQGIFAYPASHAVVMRLSTTPGDLLDDHISTPRGLAVKVIGVEGERLAGSEGDVTQDFVTVNGPVFPSPNAQKFLAGLKLLAATTDKAPGLKKALSAVLRGTEKALEAVGGESAT
ncbi:MAG TPA: catalase, partial [Janthinobacterium sp.]|nr:catalase [Janthinobacterium sp.]